MNKAGKFGVPISNWQLVKRTLFVVAFSVWVVPFISVEFLNNALGSGRYGFLMLYLIAACICGGLRLAVRSRLSAPFGECLKFVALVPLCYPVAAFFGYVHFVGIDRVWMFVFGCFLLLLASDIAEHPAPPPLSREIFGRENMMATAPEVDRALKTKARPFDPHFRD